MKVVRVKYVNAKFTENLIVLHVKLYTVDSMCYVEYYMKPCIYRNYMCKLFIICKMIKTSLIIFVVLNSNRETGLPKLFSSYATVCQLITCPGPASKHSVPTQLYAVTK